MKRILLVGSFPPVDMKKCFGGGDFSFRYAATVRQAVVFLQEGQVKVGMVMFSLSHESAPSFMELRYFMLKHPELSAIPLVTVSDYPSPKLRRLSRKFGAHDYITPLTLTDAVCSRLKQLAAWKDVTPELSPLAVKNAWRRPPWKRLFDLCGAVVLLLILSPVFILTALLIKLESAGPVFYVSKRAGQGYKIFDFYKFRSMRVDAEKGLGQLNCHNAYRKSISWAQEFSTAYGHRQLLVQDDGLIEEVAFLQKKQEKKAGTFIKIKNDPRVTRIGRFIRATSIDELPQLFNVLMGDMSLVGNRPIPLYEAERLTSDLHIARFFAPAGITGLWQVTKNCKNNISEDERKLLDVEYARNYNFWMDLHILLRTIPAAFQQENA